MRFVRLVQRVPVERRHSMSNSHQSWTTADSCARRGKVNSCSRIAPRERAIRGGGWAMEMRAHRSQMGRGGSAAKCCTSAVPNLEGGS